jgi:DNA-binding NarL/FixJ family response regulator
MNKPTRVMIVDDRRRSREGLQALLATTPEVEVVCEAIDGNEAVRLAGEFQPDVVLMDVKMAGMDGLEATREIKRQHPDMRVILLTMYINHRQEALTAGADAFLIKGCPAEQLLDSILDCGTIDTAHTGNRGNNHHND